MQEPSHAGASGSQSSGLCYREIRFRRIVRNVAAAIVLRCFSRKQTMPGQFRVIHWFFNRCGVISDRSWASLFSGVISPAFTGKKDKHQWFSNLSGFSRFTMFNRAAGARIW
jgi:hypothetical protein